LFIKAKAEKRLIELGTWKDEKNWRPKRDFSSEPVFIVFTWLRNPAIKGIHSGIIPQRRDGGLPLNFHLAG